MDGLELFCCFRDWGRVEMQREERSWGGKGRLQIGRITEYQWGPCQVGWKLLFCSPVCHGQNRHFLSLMMKCADWNTGSVDTRVLLATAVYAVPVSFLEQLLISHQYFVQWSMQKACTVYLVTSLELNFSSLFNKGCQVVLPPLLEMRSTGLESKSCKSKSPALRVIIWQMGCLWVIWVSLNSFPTPASELISCLYSRV